MIKNQGFHAETHLFHAEGAEKAIKNRCSLMTSIFILYLSAFSAPLRETKKILRVPS
jgi:hypothetical protein